MDRRLSRSTLGLIVLGMVVAALVAFAIRTPSPPDETDQTANAPPAGTPTAPTGSVSPSPTAENPPASPPAELASETVLLSVVDDETAAVRGLSGDCETGGAVLESSDDGGATWDALEVPARGLLRVKAVSDREMWVVGTDEVCNARFIRSTNGGRTWSTNTGTDGAWHLLPSGAAEVHAPESNVDSPCEDGTAAVDLAATNSGRAAVLCQGGRVHTTRNSGETWLRAGAVDDATALAFRGASTGFAAAPGDATCDGTRVSRSTDNGLTWDERGCVEGAADGVALAFSSKTVGLLATVDETWRTDDAGRTWTRL